MQHPHRSSTLPAILQACKSLRRTTIRDVAHDSMVAESRCYRIFDGRTEPKPEELDRLCKTLGIDASALTAMFPSTGSVVPIVALLPQLEAKDVKAEEVPLVIDRVHLTAEVKDEQHFENAVIPQIQGRAGAQQIFWKPSTDLKNSYGQVYGLGPGISAFTQPRRSRMQYLLLMFHPQSPDLSVVYDVLKDHLEEKTLRVSLLDVAVDLPLDIHEVQVVSRLKRKHSMVVGSQGVETIYAGKRGAGQVKFYDKIRDLRRKETSNKVRDWHYNVVPAGPLTRCEVTAKLDHPKLIPLLENPFDKVELLLLRSKGLAFLEKLGLNYARFLGWPLLRAQLGKVSYEELRQRIETSSPQLRVAHPAEVFDLKWKQVAADLMLKLGLPSAGV